MPAVRSSKGKTAAKGKTPRQHLKDNVDPCEICGVVVSRKSDVPRHAKRHASDAEKLPCPWEGCTFRTLQKSNLDTHYRRHTQDRSYNCTDDPDSCKFQTCDPASLLRHRKRLHGYTPRASVGYKDEKPFKHIPIRVIRGVEADSGSVASHFSTFSSGASTSGSSSSATASRPLSPPDSLSPSPTPSSSPSTSPSPPPRSHVRIRPRPISAANSSGESEISPSPPSTPIASTSDRKLTPERSSPTVLSMTSSPVYPTGKSLLFPDNFLLAHTTKDYAWGLSPVDLPVTPELLDGSVVSSPGSERLEFQYPEEDMNDQPPTILVEDGLGILPLPLRLPDMEKVWPGYKTAGQLNGSEGLKIDKQRSLSSKTTQSQFENQVTFGMSINGSPFIQSHSLPIDFFRNSLDGYDCKPEIYHSLGLPFGLDPLGLEIGFKCGGGAYGGSGTATLDVDANPALAARYDDMADQIILVESNTLLDSIAGDQLCTETIPNTTTTNADMESDLINVDDVSSHTSLNHLNLSQWGIFTDPPVAKDDLDGECGCRFDAS